MFFNKKNPTAKWERHSTNLAIDLDNRTLNGFGLGEPLEAVRFLGPDEDRNTHRNGELSYYSQGLVVEFDLKSHKLKAFHVVSEDPENVEFTPYSQTVTKDGRPFPLASLTAKNCQQQLGEPFWVDEQDDEEGAEVLFFYEFPGAEWQVEFDMRSGSLARWIITNEPLMANEAQREMYGVTKPYPFGA